MLQFFIICALIFIKDALTQNCEAEDQFLWSYHGPNNDPYYWADDYPDCEKEDQSPVEIWYKDIVNLYFPKLKYTGFNTPITKATVQNLGWTVMVIPEDGAHRFITWGDDTYTLEEIHFHFGNKSDPGAEHVLDGIRYEMEIHYVTHQDKNPDNLAIIASLMQATDNHNSGFDPIIEVLSDVRFRDDSSELESDLNLAGLVPQDSKSYYYYMGSNSIPPCESGYTWWVLKDIGTIGNDQLAEFMTLYSVGEADASDSCLMGRNYRPSQDLDNRPIISSEC